MRGGRGRQGSLWRGQRRRRGPGLLTHQHVEAMLLLRELGPQHKVERRSGQPKKVELFDFDGGVPAAGAAG